MAEKLSEWLLKGPTGGLSLPFDIFILFVLRVIYLAARFSLKVVLGKKRRDKLYSKKSKLSYRNYDFSASFLALTYLSHIKKFLRLGNTFLLKLNVPKYNYKVYCPANKDDFLNMTTREGELLERFNPKEGDVVVDVGAHIGRYTLISSKRVGSKGKVVAIEAHPSVSKMLNKNITLNQITNVTSLNNAVYSKETKIKLYDHRKQVDATIYNTVMTGRVSDQDAFVEVDANTLDNILQQNGIKAEDVNWLKVDVEGAELEVLRGATNVLSKSKNITLLVEIHNVDSNHKNFYTSIMDLLGQYNFKIEFEQSYASGERHVFLRKNRV
jgi:FkbM family methyltransferase